MALSVTTLVTSTQDGIVAGVVPFVSGTFNVAAGSLLVLTEGFEADAGDAPTITWTGGTPAGATAWTRRVNSTYNDGVGDQQAATIWTAFCQAAQTAVSVTHTNSVTIVNGIVLQLVVRQVVGASSNPFVGNTGTGATTSGSQTINVNLTSQQANSLVLGVVGTANGSTLLTVASGTTSDSNSSLATSGAAYLACHATALTSGAVSVTIGATNTNTFAVGAVLEILDGARTQTETVTTSEAFAAAQVIPVTQAESATATTAFAAAALMSQSQSETATASDAFAAALALTASQSESAATSDAYDSGNLISASQAETATASALFSIASGNVLTAAYSESATAGDSFDAGLALLAAQTESATASASFALLLAMGAIQAESASCSDSYACALVMGASYIESTGALAFFDNGSTPGKHKAAPFYPWWYRLQPLNKMRIR